MLFNRKELVEGTALLRRNLIVFTMLHLPVGPQIIDSGIASVTVGTLVHYLVLSSNLFMPGHMPCKVGFLGKSLTALMTDKRLVFSMHSKMVYQVPSL